jgi:cell division protein FtsI (penicillin-binding protein 3)
LHAVHLHESAHVEQRDCLVLALAQVCVAVQWPQPLAWLLLRRLRRECELSADEAVLASGLRPSSYAEHLLAVARDFVATPGAVAMAAAQSELGRRIAALLAHDPSRKPLTRLGALATTCGALLALHTVASAKVSAAVSAAVPSPVAQQSSVLGAHLGAAGPGQDAQLQGIVQDEATQLKAQWQAERVALVVLAVDDARVLAHWDDKPTTPIVPASTLKPLVVASALEQGKITLDQLFDCGNGERVYPSGNLRDWKAFGALQASEIVAASSNIGISRIFDALGAAGLRTGLDVFGMKIPVVEAGSIAGAVTAIGQRNVTTTPLELAAAYRAFASDGEYRSPGGASARRAFSAQTAHAVANMLDLAVNGPLATGAAARLSNVRVAGKTGNVDGGTNLAEFIGLLPADKPRYVIYVGVGESPRELSGGSVAAPAFARLAARVLASE